MRRDHRPYALKRAQSRFESWWLKRFVAPQLAALGPHAMVMKPWNLKPYGDGIALGESVHVITSRDRPVRLTTWAFDGHQGEIHIGDYALLCPGVRIDSASRVSVGPGTMFAANAYVTDADWHDLYDRARPIGATAPVVLEANVWLGDSAIVCKGVTVGENSVIGAGSVVTKDVPPNCIAAGNPARVVRELDADRAVQGREALLADAAALARDNDQLERYLLSANTWTGWLRAVFAPRQGD